MNLNKHYKRLLYLKFRSQMDDIMIERPGEGFFFKKKLKTMFKVALNFIQSSDEWSTPEEAIDKMISESKEAKSQANARSSWLKDRAEYVLDKTMSKFIPNLLERKFPIEIIKKIMQEVSQVLIVEFMKKSVLEDPGTWQGLLDNLIDNINMEAMFI